MMFMGFLKVLANLHVTGFPNESNLHGVRVGWSSDDSPFQLGR